MVKKNDARPRRLAIPKLKDKLDRVFSQYIRLRDADNNGNIRCYCCGKVLPWKESENMHFIPRQHMSLRFSEVNCHAGCTRCNHYLNGNIEEYTIHMKKEYGPDILERLTVARNRVNKISATEYEVLIYHYKKEFERLKNEKGL